MGSKPHIHNPTHQNYAGNPGEASSGDRTHDLDLQLIPSLLPLGCILTGTLVYVHYMQDLIILFGISDIEMLND